MMLNLFEMPFDPISWAVGFVATNAAKRGLELWFPSDLRTSLENEIVDWSKTLPSFVHPATLFSVVDSSNSDEFCPALARVHSQLLDLVIPTDDEWRAAFIEQWRSIATRLGGQAQPFFQLSEEEVSPYFTDLAARVHAKCAQDQKIVLPHIVHELDQIQVTLAELLQLQALRAIPPHSGTDRKSVDRVIRTVVNLGMHRGWSNAFVAQIVSEGSLRIVIAFAESDRFEPVVSVVEIEEERLAIWSSLGDTVIETAISSALFESPLFAGVEQNWNSMVTFVGSISRTLYPNSVRNGVFGISARFDLKRIGVPFPSNREPRSGDERVLNLKLDENELLVPFLTFGQPELEQLVGVSPADASGVVAGWLFREWGRPSLSSSSAQK
jgi:hypothetical protein